MEVGGVAYSNVGILKIASSDYSIDAGETAYYVRPQLTVKMLGLGGVLIFAKDAAMCLLARKLNTSAQNINYGNSS